MKTSRILWMVLAAAFALAARHADAQDYRARVQGTVSDTSQAVLPGVTVTLSNDATGVASTRVTDADGRYLFDFVDPGLYTLTAALDGFKTAQQRAVRVAQRGDLTVPLQLEIGALTETVTVEVPPVTVQFNTSSSQLTVEQQLLDQMPISGRNPYNIAALDPTVVVSPAANENRPYHHAYANDYDAGGGTRRANDVLLDGVPLGASFKTSYTPAVDAVEEITISKNSVDAENGNSLGGIISLNMKSGTNQFRGSAYGNFRSPSMNARTDPTLVVAPGTTPLRGSDLQMLGATLGGPILKNRMFSFTSYEQWNDTRPLSIVRTVPTEFERNGDFSRSVLNGNVRTIYNPFTSALDPAGRVVRTPFAGNVIPASMIDPVARKMLAGHSAAEPGRQRRQLAGQRRRAGGLLELLPARGPEPDRQPEGVRALRHLQGRPLPAESGRQRGRLLPALGEQPRRHEPGERRRLGDVEEHDPERARQLLQHGRRVLQPVAAARRGRPVRLLVEQLVLVALQQRLRLLSRARRHLRHRHQHQQPARAARAASGTSTRTRGPSRRA